VCNFPLQAPPPPRIGRGASDAPRAGRRPTDGTAPVARIAPRLAPRRRSHRTTAPLAAGPHARHRAMVSPKAAHILLPIVVGLWTRATADDAVISRMLSELRFPMMDGEPPLTQSTRLAFHTRCGGLPQSVSCGNGGKHWGATTPPTTTRPGDCYQVLPNGSLGAPPPGLRSAAAMGGLGTGSFALHADGTFAEWTVEHARVSSATWWEANGTRVHNPARVFLLADAFVGVRVSAVGDDDDGDDDFASAFRTEPPEGVRAAEGMTYSSASPVSRLQLRDSQLAGVEASLFAHYRWTMGDSNASSTPAVTFTLQLTNNRHTAVNASLLLSMPLASNEGYSREGPSANETATGCDGPIDPGSCRAPPPTPQPTKRYAGTASPAECQRLCGAAAHGWAACTSWTWSSGLPGASAGGGGGGSNLGSSACVLQAGRPPQPCRKSTESCSVDASGAGCGLMPGVFSGLAGTWSGGNGSGSGRGLTHSRAGEWDASGGITLRSVGEHPSYMTAESPADIWRVFTSGSSGSLTTDGDGTAGSTIADQAGHGHGAASSSVVVQPGETRSVSIVLAWYLPLALYTGQPLGVHYANSPHYNSSEGVADFVVGTLQQQLQDALSWNRLLVNSSLPDWLAALLVNTPATEIESGFWTADGRYRQYDNIYAPDISVHVHMFSMIPFVSFHPALVKDIVKTCQARLQCPPNSKDPKCPPGMVQEVCGNAGWGNRGCGNASQNWCGFSVGMMDSGGGRIMGDVTSIFILEALQVWRQTADRPWLASIWPSLIRAVEWEVGRSKGLGLPTQVCTTYDYLEIARSPGQVGTYSSFLYLLSLRAARVLVRMLSPAP
jgi:hypothetical protein